MFRQDARHWIAVYRQMIAFKDELLDRMRAEARTLPASGRQDEMENDVAVIGQQLMRYQRRSAVALQARRTGRSRPDRQPPAARPLAGLRRAISAWGPPRGLEMLTAAAMLDLDAVKDVLAFVAQQRLRGSDL